MCSVYGGTVATLADARSDMIRSLLLLIVQGLIWFKRRGLCFCFFVSSLSADVSVSVPMLLLVLGTMDPAQVVLFVVFSWAAASLPVRPISAVLARLDRCLLQLVSLLWLVLPRRRCPGLVASVASSLVWGTALGPPGAGGQARRSSLP